MATIPSNITPVRGTSGRSIATGARYPTPTRDTSDGSGRLQGADRLPRGGTAREQNCFRVRGDRQRYHERTHSRPAPPESRDREHRPEGSGGPGAFGGLSRYEQPL